MVQKSDRPTAQRDRTVQFSSLLHSSHSKQRAQIHRQRINKQYCKMLIVPFFGMRFITDRTAIVSVTHTTGRIAKYRVNHRTIRVVNAVDVLLMHRQAIASCKSLTSRPNGLLCTCRLSVQNERYVLGDITSHLSVHFVCRFFVILVPV